MHHTGTPRTKFFVPSIGSSTHCRPAESRCAAELFAEHRIIGTARRQRRPQQLFGRFVGVGDRRKVGFGIDPQIERTEPVQASARRRRRPVSRREGEVIRDRGHGSSPTTGPRVAGSIELAFVEETHQHGGDVFEAVVDAGGATGSVAVHGVLGVLHAQNCEPGGCGGPDAVARVLHRIAACAACTQPGDGFLVDVGRGLSGGHLGAGNRRGGSTRRRVSSSSPGR